MTVSHFSDALVPAAIGVFLLFPSVARAQASNDSDRLTELERQVQSLSSLLEQQRQSYETRLSQLESRLGAGPVPGTPGVATPEGKANTPPGSNPDDETARLEDEFARALGVSGTRPAPNPPIAAAGPLKLIDISLDSLIAAGTSTATEDELEFLEGGGHDPHTRGFTVQNLELSLSGVVDPYLKGNVNIVSTLDTEGETHYEVEEAYATTMALPAGLQIKAGQYFSPFGRLNPQHPHEWSLVDQPIVSSRFLGGEGLRGAGAQLSWIPPLPFYAEVIGSIQNARGETMVSFLGEEDATIGGHPIVRRLVRTFDDLVYVPRLTTSHDLSDSTTLVLGTSGAFGPNGTGGRTSTEIYGADAYLKWKPLTNDHGWPFVKLQTEFLWRRYEAGGFTLPDDVTSGGDVAVFDVSGSPVTVRGADVVTPGAAVSASTLRDWGTYAQLDWGFSRSWVAGLRFDYSDGAVGNAGDPFRDRRWRWATAVTFFPSEFSKIRLQGSIDEADRLIDSRAYSIFLQFEYLLGTHGAHKF